MRKRTRIILFLVFLLLLTLNLFSVAYILDKNGIVDFPDNSLFGFLSKEDIIKEEGDTTSDEEENNGEEKEEEESPVEFSGEVTEWPDDVPDVFPVFIGGTISTATQMKKNERYESTWVLSYFNVSSTQINTYMSNLENEGWGISDLITTDVWKIYTASTEKYVITVMQKLDEDITNFELMTR